MRHENAGPIYTNRQGGTVLAPESREGLEFSDVYQMSNGRRTDQPGRYFAFELGLAEPVGGRLAERLNAQSLAALSEVDGRTVKQMLEDNNFK